MEAKVIKDKLVAVDYPGVVVKPQNMLHTLGGEDNITKVYKDPVKRLDMKLRPNDVFCKPACADRRQTHQLLLKVSRKKPPDIDGRCNTKTEDIELEGEIVGIAETVYKFESMADYQYLAMKNKEDCSGYTSFYNKVVPDGSKQLLSEWMKDESVPLFLPSPIYSRLDRPVEYAYKDKPNTKQHRELGPEGAITLDRAKRPHFSKFHSFKGGPVPTEPYPEAMDRLKNKTGYKNELRSIDRLKELFEERPLWTRVAIKERCGISKDTLKHCLPIVSYYWETGPWRTMWCVYGYDPRKTPEAKMYQLVDFRLKGNNFSAINIKRSSTKDYNLPSTVLRTGTSVSVPTIRPGDLQERSNRELPREKEQVYVWKFLPTVIPSQRQFFYQLLDIEVPNVQRVIHSNDNEDPKCTERDGWCVAGYADEVRAIMTSIVASLIEKTKADSTSDTATSEKSWKDRAPLRPFVSTEKGKSGPKHKAKSSDSLKTSIHPAEGSTSIKQSQKAKLMDYDSESGDSDAILSSSSNTSDDGEDNLTGDGLQEFVEREKIDLRTRVSMENTLGDLNLKDLGLSDEGDNLDEEMLTDSDNDPCYDPKKDPDR